MGIIYHHQSAFTSTSKYDRYIDHEFFSYPLRKNSAANSLVEALFCILMVGATARRIWKYNIEKEDVPSTDDVEKGTAPLLQRTAKNAQALDAQQVFLPPSRDWILAALLGNGWHLLVWAFVMTIWFKDKNPLEYGLGGRLELMIYGYAASSIIAGYTSAYHFQQQQSVHGVEARNVSWKVAVAVTALFVPVFVATVVMAHATIAVPAHVIDIISMQGALRLISLLLLVIVPSHVTGAFIGRWHQARHSDRISSFLVISIPHYLTKREARFRYAVKLRNFFIKAQWFVPALGGFLAFSVIYVELYYVMASIWKYKFYLIGWMDLVALGLLLMVLCAYSAWAAVFTLSYPSTSETPRLSWQWIAFISSASTGGYVFLYSIYYLMNKTVMEGVVAIVHYFGTMLVISTEVALACGAVGHFAAYHFVTLLYSNIKAA